MAVWNFSVLFLCHCEVFPGENLHIHYGAHGNQQILQNSKANQVPSYFQKEIHRHNSIACVGYFHHVQRYRSVCLGIQCQRQPNLRSMPYTISSFCYPHFGSSHVFAVFSYRSLLLENLQSCPGAQCKRFMAEFESGRYQG